MRKKRLHAVCESRRLAGAAAIAVAICVAPVVDASTSRDNAGPDWIAAVPCAAQTGSSPATGDRPSRSRLILGGAPSALDKIRASQQAGRTDVGTLMEPASPAPVAFSVQHDPQSLGNCRTADALPDIARGQGLADHYAALLAADPAAELGSRAIPIKRTRYDSRWERVLQAPATQLMTATLGRANVHSGLNEAEKLQRINSWVNQQIAYRADELIYRQRDYWATAAQTIARGAGDCEDYAILKMHMLRAAGVGPDRMKLVLLRDLAANADHAVLLVQTDRGKVVLDNTTDQLYDGSIAIAVRPVLSFGEKGRWVHAVRAVQTAATISPVPAS